ncbi:hypothetical protein Pla175_07990 [Pirellulimonas nuda]|uniref:Peptidase MA-like domain-containing protein n=1 Tax=Pirellulimonas nuda TaxID=2528009 RepID=A0A518D7I1_9BACT|nr:hypothetical protein [Pirellulimonas nuda]QDU87437.1 hypothetical protein Pla175_07990 [Pirellulimonas nuda]
MDARRPRATATAALAALLLLIAPAALATSGYRTANFVVSAPSAELAREIGETAEILRKQLAVEWTGKEMPNWPKPCPIKARVHPNLGAGGQTSFVFDRGQVFNWDMEVQGSRERVLDSVLPHEITHTVFACHFRRPLPRWADEGACTTVEDRSEIAKQERMLIGFLKAGDGIPFSRMFAMKEYPAKVLPLYAQGHSLTQFLLERRGKETFMAFVADGMQDENWPRAVKAHYEHENLLELQLAWNDWVRVGRPRLEREDGVGLASATRPASQPVQVAAATNSVYSASLTPAESAKPASGAVKSGSIYDASNTSGTIWR